MCGITGFVSRNAVNGEVIKDMTGELYHRGPDAGGTFFRKINNCFCGLGHRRLSIMDLSNNAAQPMFDRTENYILSFNGEIYNYPEIKKDLLTAGYDFKSNSDTEILLYGLIEYGTNLLQRLNGMFAFAFLDVRAGELLIARDRFGQKPLFYGFDECNFFFASELKSLFKHPAVKPEISEESLVRYLCFEYCLAPDSLIKNIRKLEPGNFAVFNFKDEFQFRTEKYWSPDLIPDPCFNNLPEKKITSLILEKLKNSIGKRMMSDVPIGVFLSGGIDSSAIPALLSEITETKKIKTFSLGFKEASFDESSHAKLVAKIFGTDHHHKILKSSDLLDYIPKIIDKLDEPMADSSIIPTYALSEFTRKHVTVALGGDGGDELFAGYDPFLAHFWANKIEFLPDFLLKFFREQANKIPVSDKNMSLDFKIKSFLKGLRYPLLERNQRWMGAFSSDDFRDLFSELFYKKVKNSDVYDSLNFNFALKDDYIARVAEAYQKTYLPDDILVKVDRASMMNSLEVRSPFLDVEFAEFVNKLPSRFKFRMTTRKYILKKALETKLPDSIIYRKKKGFGIPLTQWLREELYSEIKSTFYSSRLANSGIINPRYYKKILNEHLTRKKDNRKPIWTLYILEKWLQKNDIIC
ncbi:MAG: asparagine synthase (glutamine-hydrolyzing) [Candidatus Cloacimonadota bacterium]|nr:MAG: asparagine synthase (glutamine-hydrolyzing) [Candidatus Cloacimonadota bacterium]